MNSLVQPNCDQQPTSITSSRGKSAFTPILQKPMAYRHSPVNLFEPSPIQKFLLFSALAQQHQEAAANAIKKVLSSPMKVTTPSQFLRAGCGTSADLVTSGLMRQDSYFLSQQILMAAPKGFSYDVILPNKSLLQTSPLNECTNTDGSSFLTDLDKDMDSTDYSQERQDEDLDSNHKKLLEKQKKRKQLEINGIVIDNYLASENLNECVDFLLRKEKTEFQKSINKVIRHNLSGKAKEKKKRQRKNLDQHQILHEYFEKNPTWDKQTIQKLSDIIGLKESQIYKWNWDQRKKCNIEPQTDF